MRRGKSQAVYKFLPGMWVSEKNDYGRTITAEIKNWNNKKMENIYHNFIEGEIKRQIIMFGEKGGDIRAFNLEGDNCFVIVEPACNEGIPDIVGVMSPLLFYCGSCHHTFQLNNQSQINNNTWKCSNCGSHSIKQLQMIYTCECGYAQPIKRPYVKGIKTDLLYKPNQNPYKMFYMDGNAEKPAEFSIVCPNCSSWLIPDNAESSRNYKPFSLSIINLVDKKSGDFFEKGIEAQKIVIAKWFEKVSQKQFDDIVNNVELAFSPANRNSEQRKKAEEQIKSLIELGFIKEENFDSAVNEILAKDKKGGSVEDFAAECDSLFSKMKSKDEKLYNFWISSYAYKLMQYNTLKNAKTVITLEDSINKQLELEFIESKDDILKLNNKLGIKDMQVSCDVEVISCTYGYTRKTADPVISSEQNKKCRLKLNAFDRAKDINATLVYGAKLETEGILFEISQSKIIEWLYKNKIIEEEQLPDLDDEVSVKKWYAEYVNGNAVSMFGEIDEAEKITKNVFSLLHSMSHAFIKTAGEISGLSSNSLTEIIIVETASIFVYAQTTQALPLGALSGMAENNYALFLKKTYEDNKNCVFDPICTERDGTKCSACLIIPEISCKNFNNELGRKFLYNIENMENPMIGFWEM